MIRSFVVPLRLHHHNQLAKVREGLGHRDGAEPKGQSPVRGGSSDPMNRSRCDEHGGPLVDPADIGCARPTGGSHGRTTDAPEQRFNGVNLRDTLEVG
jgi:hypothetical protein